MKFAGGQAGLARLAKLKRTWLVPSCP